MTPHLTHEQLCDFVLDLAPHPLSSDFAALQQHLANCPACTAELATLRSSISLFRDASTACARQQLAQFHANNTLTPRPHAFFHPIYWATAAAMIVAAALPLTLHRPDQPPPAPRRHRHHSRTYASVRRGPARRDQPGDLCARPVAHATPR